MTGRWSCWIRGGVAERPILGGYQSPHGLPSGGLWRGVRRSRKGTGMGFAKIDNSGGGYDIYGCPRRHQADGLSGAWPRPGVRVPGKEAHCSAAGGQA